MIKAITFDFWWTLYEGKTPGGGAWRLQRLAENLERLGSPRDTGELERAVRTVHVANELQQEELGLDWTSEEQVERFLQHLNLPARLVPDLLEAWTTPLLHHRPQPMPDVRAVLAELAQAYRLAVICNTGSTPGWVLRELMAADGLAEHFQVLTFSNEHRMAKPNPQIYHLTVSALQVPPATAIHIGDNPRTDVAGARGAGLRAVWFNSRAMDDSAPGADGVIHRLSELPSLLARIG